MTTARLMCNVLPIVFGLLLGLLTIEARSAELAISMWAGNTPESDRRLGVTAIRRGCSSEPAKCVKALADSAEAQAVPKWIINIKGDATKFERDSLLYSQLSVGERRLIEVGVDDFFSTMKSWEKSTGGRAYEVLAKAIGNAKVRNHDLQFGITLYENQLSSPLISSIPAETRASINRVVLYLHYRKNAKNYAQYVARAQSLFPGAAIWAGSYAYDRIDYLPCEETGKQSCGVDEESALYAESLRIQLKLWRDGVVAGIEFYPGFFGREDEWNGWSKARICRPERKQECIETTRKLRRIAEQELLAIRKNADGLSGALIEGDESL